LFWRGFLVDGKPDATVKMAKETIKIYPLASPEQRDNMKFINYTGVYYNTVHANNIKFYEEIHTVIDQEPASAFSPEFLGLLAGIGIEKGRERQAFCTGRRDAENLKRSRCCG
jgi:hypothetical protein